MFRDKRVCVFRDRRQVSTASGGSFLACGHDGMKKLTRKDLSVCTGQLPLPTSTLFALGKDR